MSFCCSDSNDPGSMQTCRVCGAGSPDSAQSCDECGADLTAEPAVAPTADLDKESEREWFQAAYGIDIGDRTVDEYLQYVERQDYSLTTWFWLLVGVEFALSGVLGYTLIGPAGWELLPVVMLLSVLLSATIYADTAFVGLFDRWSRIRWLYIAFPLVPYYGQISTAIYLVLRRIERERTERKRRRLNESGFDVGL